MKKIYKDAILNITSTDIFDEVFLFEALLEKKFPVEREIIYIKDLLEKKKNEEIFSKLEKYPAMRSEVYSPKDELTIFTELFEGALKNNKKIHIVWITLDEEIEMLEKYYSELGFMRVDINAFDVDFSIPLVTASCYIENIMWKWSDYKRLWKKIFRNPPIREAGQVKALYKWINRGVIAGLDIEKLSDEVTTFLKQELLNEHLLSLTLWKVLKHNYEAMWVKWEKNDIKISIHIE